MKRTLLLRIAFSFLLFFILSSTFAQTPPTSLNGSELRDWLKQNYYTGKHTQLGYSTARMYMYNYIDNHNNTITGVYSGYEKTWTAGGTGTNPDPINCEHTVPQSFFGEAEPMKSDIHHLFPTYGSWNSTRSNHPFAEIDDNLTDKWMYLTTSTTTIPSSDIDLYSEYANSSFEPREDHKGDCARAIFYFYTMYPTQAGDLSKVADINVIYQWHLDDPVDTKELTRNSDVETYQGDRNPYIDQPDLVARAWNLTPTDPTVPATPTIIIAQNTTNLTLSWNNVSDEQGYKLYKSTDGNSFSLLSNITANTTNYQDNSVTEGTIYYYYVLAYNALGNSSNSNTVNGQLQTNTGGNGSTTDLIISEYIEGSSYNKALELANFTGTAVNLSNYSIKKQANGAGDWGSELILSGTLADGEVYVIVNSLSTNTTLTAKADLSTNSASIGYNGNDPVALFKNGVLIDVLGTFNNTADFAKDVTLVRNSSISSPNSTYTASEWTSYASDEFSYLGSHTVDGGTTGDTEAPTAPTNLVSSNITETGLNLSWTASTDNISVTAYDVYKDGVFLASTSATTYNVTGLTENTAYAFYVMAKDAAENISTASNTINVNTLVAADTQAPSTPSNLASSNITETGLNLSWTASTDNISVTAYDIYKDGAYLASTSVTTYNVTGLTENTAYAFYVMAKDAAGNISTASNTINVNTLVAADTQAPSTPSNLASSNITETGLNLNWTASTDNKGVTEYHIYKDGAYQTSTSATTFSVTGLTENTAYSFYVIALDAAGNTSTASNTLNITTLKAPDTQAPSAPINLSSSNITETSFTLQWDASTDNVAVTEYSIYINGNLFGNSSTLSINIAGLTASTQYALTVLASDAAGNNSAQSSVLNVSTSEPVTTPGLASDLLISEYIEGSSNNKALEIANFTGNTVDLAAYSIMKQANGSGAWGSELQLSGTLVHGKVFTIANASAIAAILTIADLSTTSQALTYNGNDAVGLFKNGQLIDIVGVFDNSAVFAENTTLVRKTSINNPSTSYNANEWDVYGSDEISYLGTHAVDGATVTFSDELIYTDFESGWDVWMDGGRDCALYTSGNYAPQGNNAANIQDNSGTGSAFYLTNSIDLATAGYSKLTIDFTFYAVSMENGEDFMVEYYDGSLWNTVAQYARGSDFENNNLYSASITLLEADYNFPTNMNLRFMCDASGNADDIYIDEIRVTATVEASQNKSENTSLVSLGKTIQPLEQDIELALNIYPMPTHGITNIDINFVEILGEIEFSLYDVQGRLLKAFTHNTSNNQLATQFDASDLKSGIYILNIHTHEFKISRKILVE